MALDAFSIIKRHAGIPDSKNISKPVIQEEKKVVEKAEQAPKVYNTQGARDWAKKEIKKQNNKTKTSKPSVSSTSNKKWTVISRSTGASVDPIPIKSEVISKEEAVKRSEKLRTKANTFWDESIAFEKELLSQKSQIKDNEMYETSMRKGRFTGTQLKQMYDTKIQDIQEQRKDIKEYQKYTQGLNVKFTKLKSGEAVKVTYKDGKVESYGTFIQDPVKYNQKQFDEADLPFKIVKSLWIGVSQAPTTVFHYLSKPFTGAKDEDLKKHLAMADIRMQEATSSIKSGVPQATFLAGVYTGDTETMKKGLGGTTPFLKETFTNPMMQEIAFTVVGMGVGKLVKPVAKGFIKTGVKSYTKVSRFVPEESLVGKAIEKAGSKIGGTTVGQNMQLWSKGYKPALKLVSGQSAKPLGRGIGSFGDDVFEYAGKETFEGGGGRLKRVFLSPKEYTKSQKFLQIIKTNKPVVDINFPRADIYAGVGEIQADMGRTSMSLKGLFNKKIVTQTYTGSITRDIGVKLPVTMTDDVLTKGRYAGFDLDIAKKAVKTSVDDIFTGSGVTPLKPYKARILIDYIDDVPVFQMKEINRSLVLSGTRPSKISAFAGKEFSISGGSLKANILDERGLINVLNPKKLGNVTFEPYVKSMVKMPSNPVKTFFVSNVKREAQRQITSYKIKHPLKYLLSEKTASQLLVKPSKITTVANSSSYSLGKMGLIQAAQKSKYIPAFSFPYISETIIYSAIKTGSMTGGKIKTDMDFITVANPDFDRMPILKPIHKSIIDTKTQDIMAPINITSTFPAYEQATSQAISFDTEQTSFTKTPKTSKIPIFPDTPVVPLYMPYIPSMGIYGRGKKGRGYSGYSRKYKFRKRKIIDPLSNIKLKNLFKKELNF